MENQLVKVINESGLDKTKAQVLLENFSNYFEIAADWEIKAKALTVTSVEQKAEMKMAREGRLFLKEKRVAVEHTRKALKESALREGQTIDAIAKILTNLILPIEEDLEHKEKFAEILEAKRRAELKAQRETEIAPYSEFVPLGLNMGNMSDDDYTKLLSGAKLQLQAKLDAEAKAEAERIAKEKAEAAERERIKIENERLRAEAEKHEKELAAQRKKAEAERKAIEEKARKEKEAAEEKLRKEQEVARVAAEKAAKERARLEAELKAREEAEKKARKDAEEKTRKAKNAPDKEKLLALASYIESAPIPMVSGDEARKVIDNTKILISKLAKYIIQNTEQL